MSTRRSPARWLAPLALIGAVVVVLLVVKAGGSSDETSSATPTRSTAVGTTTTGAAATTTTKATPKTYTVKAGDVLSRIAEETGVELTRIEELNPDVDAQTLHAGQKLKLSP